MKFAAIILAAGRSIRMGTPKQFLEVAGKPMLLHSVDAALTAGLDPVVVVTGSNAEQITKMLQNRPVQLTVNPKYKSGMGSSVATGVRFLLESKWRAQSTGAVMMLADQPLQSPALVASLIETFQQKHADGTRIVRPSFSGIGGHPVVFSKELLAELLDLQGDKGARDVIKRHQSALTVVEFNEPDQGLDVDTYSDLQQLRQIADRIQRDRLNDAPE